MLIICPSCISTYRLPEAAVRSATSAVRCAQCASVFDPAAARATLPVSAEGARSLVLHAAPVGLIREPALRPTTPDEPRQRGAAIPRGAVLAGLAVALLGLNMAGVAFRTRIAEVAPALAPVYAAIGLPAAPLLRLDGVETALSDDGAGKVLAIEGRIANAGTSETAVPNLRIVVRDGSEQSVYSWITPAPRARLAAGEAVDFRSRLVAPPSTGHDVVVSFAEPSETGSVARVMHTP